ncbi:hypothetical protein BDQ12DRAFT_755514, partial [Crucibulum laeve]
SSPLLSTVLPPLKSSLGSSIFKSWDSVIPSHSLYQRVQLASFDRPNLNAPGTLGRPQKRRILSVMWFPDLSSCIQVQYIHSLETKITELACIGNHNENPM